MPFHRLSIIGTGLLGGSLALAAKRFINGCQITGYDSESGAIDNALSLGVIDRALPIKDAVADAELTFLCTPVGQFEKVLRDISPAVRPGAVISDVGSTKRTITRLAAEILPGTAHFIGSHPMAGSEKKGVTNARADLFQGAVCMIMPSPNTPTEVTARLEKFWQTIGMTVRQLSPQEHDRVVGRISHLPQVVAMALTGIQDETTLPFAGKGFKDTTRIAGSNPSIWVDILLDNRDEVLKGLQDLRHQIDGFDRLLANGDRDALLNWLTQASTRRQKIV